MAVMIKMELVNLKMEGIGIDKEGIPMSLRHGISLSILIEVARTSIKRRKKKENFLEHSELGEKK